jgi:hypothetical protein
MVHVSTSPANFREYRELASQDMNTHISTLPLSEMRVIGEAQQQWAPLRRKYNLFLYHDSPNITTDTRGASEGLDLSESQKSQVAHSGSGEYSQFAYVDEPFLSWDFSLLTADSRLLGSVNRNFAGWGREIFTDTGVYALRMDAAGLADEPRHLISQTGRKAQLENMGMTLDQRAVMLATAVSVDFDYFSRHSDGHGWGFMPLWFPGEATAGGAAAAGEAGAAAGAAGEAGTVAGSTTATAAGTVARGAGIVEGAAVGAGTMAGYEAMQRGVYGRGAGQPPPNELGAGQSPPPQEPQGEEDVWGTGRDPWSGGGDGGTGGSGGSGGGSGGGGGGGGGGGDGGWTDWF